MLYRFLKTIKSGDMQSMLEIAHTMDISQDMVRQMAKELTNKGYLQEIGADCEEPQKGCPDCPVNSTCQAIVKHWLLTEKGKTAISGATIEK
jgi:hypothetical protein